MPASDALTEEGVEGCSQLFRDLIKKGLPLSTDDATSVRVQLGCTIGAMGAKGVIPHIGVDNLMAYLCSASDEEIEALYQKE